MVGFIVALYWITKSIFQAFIVDILKIQKGEKDDFNFLIKGLFVANLVPLGYFFANQIIHIFILELISCGLGYRLWSFFRGDNRRDFRL